MLSRPEEANMIVSLAAKSGVVFKYQGVSLSAVPALQDGGITRDLLKIGLYSLGVKTMAKMTGEGIPKSISGETVPAALVGLAIDYAFSAAPRTDDGKKIDVQQLAIDSKKIDSLDGSIHISEELVQEVRKASEAYMENPSIKIPAQSGFSQD